MKHRPLPTGERQRRVVSAGRESLEWLDEPIPLSATSRTRIVAFDRHIGAPDWLTELLEERAA